MDAALKALADRCRRKLRDRLFQSNGQTLSELCGGQTMTRRAVTKHLAVLERANLVATEWRGREKLHYLNPVPIQQIADRWVRKCERSRLEALTHLKSQPEERSDDE